MFRGINIQTVAIVERNLYKINMLELKREMVLKWRHTFRLELEKNSRKAEDIVNPLKLHTCAKTKESGGN